MTAFLSILFMIAITISNVMTKCTFASTKKNVQISCTHVTSEDYLTNIFEIRADIINSMPTGNVAKFGIDVADSYVPIIDDWIFLPWDDHFPLIQSISVVNSSVNSVKSLPKLAFVETLNLSRNNISDYRFLSKMKKLRYLYLSHNRFDSNSYLFTYLQKENTRLNLVDLSYCNLDKFGVITNLIESYNLSFNPNLTLIQFNHSVGYRSPFLNFSGNNNHVNLMHLRSIDFCVSVDLSNFNGSFDFSLLNTIHISEKILLNNNNLSMLNERTFKISKLFSKKCMGRISVDISNSQVTDISPNFFSGYTFDLLNLSNNNLSILKGSIFRQSDVLELDLSSSNITSIEPSVFNYFSVNMLNLSKNNISALDGVFDYVESMKHLDISSNPLGTLSESTLKNCRDLESLNLANVFIKSFGENTFSNLHTLKTLILSFKDSLNSTLIKNMHVTELVITNTTLNRLNEEQFKGFYKLKKLTFRDSSVKAIDNSAFKGLTNLKRINNLKQFGEYNINVFQQLHSLEHLDLSQHDLKKLNLEFKDLYSLRKLNLSSNAISLLDINSFSTLKQLEVLTLSDNQLSTLAVGIFRNLKKLTHLYLNKNQLQLLAPGVFSALDELFVLDLSQNDLLRTKPHLVIAISMPKLTYLYLQGNGIGSEYAKGDDILRKNELTIIANHNQIKYIDINQNGWRCPTLIDVLTVFKNKNISYNPTNSDYTTTNINGVSCT